MCKTFIYRLRFNSKSVSPRSLQLIENNSIQIYPCNCCSWIISSKKFTVLATHTGRELKGNTDHKWKRPNKWTPLLYPTANVTWFASISIEIFALWLDKYLCNCFWDIFRLRQRESVTWTWPLDEVKSILCLLPKSLYISINLENKWCFMWHLYNL